MGKLKHPHDVWSELFSFSTYPYCPLYPHLHPCAVPPLEITVPPERGQRRASLPWFCHVLGFLREGPGNSPTAPQLTTPHRGLAWLNSQVPLASPSENFCLPKYHTSQSFTFLALLFQRPWRSSFHPLASVLSPFPWLFSLKANLSDTCLRLSLLLWQVD